MAFNIMDMFAPAARNRLLQPIESTVGIPNMLLTQPSPQSYPVAPVPATEPMQTAAVAPPVASPPVASPAPVTPATAPVVPASPGIADRYSTFVNSDRGQALNDLFTGWAAGSTPSESLAYGAKLTAANKQDRKAKNDTVDWLKGRGVSEDEARFLASSPVALNDYLKSIYAKSDNLINAGGSLYNRDTGEWITPPAGASRPTEYGLNLIYGKDGNGKTVAYQLSKDGTYKPFEPPAGVELSPGLTNTDLGTSVITRNSKTGEIIDTQAKDVSGVASQQASGTATGEAKAALPGAEMTANMVAKQIDELKSDPYLDRMVGSFDSRLPNITSDAARVQGKMNQIQGGAFLQARNMLKGGGAITDFEGAKAEDAFARLQTAQNEGDYRKALDDFNEAVQMGLRKLQRQAGQAGSPAPGGASDPLGLR